MWQVGIAYSLMIVTTVVIFMIILSFGGTLRAPVSITRSLVELIVLNVGLDLRVLSPALFAVFVIMAVVTTMMTSPILALLTRGRREGVEHAAGSVARGPAR